MNTQELYRKDNDVYKVVKYFCGRCGTIHNDRNLADNCCQSLYCEKCGKEIKRDNKQRHYDRYYINPLRCGECYDKDQAAKIPIVPLSEYKGEPVLDNDRYYSDLGDFFEAYECDGDELPEYVELCDIEHLPKLDSYQIMGQLLEDCNLEDYDNLYIDEQELHDFAKQWNEKQTGKLWTPNGKRLLITEEVKKKYGYEEESM